MFKMWDLPVVMLGKRIQNFEQHLFLSIHDEHLKKIEDLRQNAVLQWSSWVMSLKAKKCEKETIN